MSSRPHPSDAVLGKLDRANAQGEEYLSGFVGLLSAEPDRFRVRALHVEDPEAILGYNNPAELLAVESVIQARKQGAKPRAALKGEVLKPIRAWQSLFDGESRTESSAPGADIRPELETIYGRDGEVLRERYDAYRELLARARPPSWATTLRRSS